MSGIKKYAKPSKIKMTLKPEPKKETYYVEDTQLGDVFTLEGGVHMRVHVSAYQSFKDDALFAEVRQTLDATAWIINLQTGRVFATKLDREIEWVGVTMLIDSE